MNPPEKKVGAWWFEGTWTTPIPTALVFDARLTPGDRLLWIAMRCTMTQAKSPIKPTYDYLIEACSMSRSALSRSLKALRLTGWAATRRVATNGYIEGQVYSLFDADQSVELMDRLDVRAFVVECQVIPGRIGRLASSVADRFGISCSKLLLPNTSSSKLELLDISGSSKLELPENPGSSKLELPENPGSSKLELPSNPRSINLLPPENQQLTSGSNLLPPRARSSSSSSSTTTTASVRADARVYVWPQELSDLSRRTCTADLGQLDLPTAQAVLDELAAQLPSGKVKNPTVYLRTLITKAIAGTFEFTDGGDRIARARQQKATTIYPIVASRTQPLPPVSLVTRSAWDIAVQQLALEFDAESVELWIKPLMLREQAQELTVFASNTVVLSEVRIKFLPRLQELFSKSHPHLRRIVCHLGDGQGLLA